MIGTGHSRRGRVSRAALIVAFLALQTFVPGCSRSPSITPVTTVGLELPDDVGPILVLADRLPGKEAFVQSRAEQVAIGLRHFSAHTSWAYVDDVPLEQVSAASAVVLLGLNGNDPLSADALSRLRLARRLIVSRYHLARLRDAGIAFTHTGGGKDVAAPKTSAIRYNGHSFPSSPPDLLDLKVKEPAKVFADYLVMPSRETGFPFIVQDGDALFVNGELAFDSNDATRRGAMIAVCDLIAQFLGARPSPGRPRAMLRIEDVSALTPASQLNAVVDYLAQAHVPYGLGVIPDLYVKDKVVPPLQDNGELLNAIRWAQDRGATIILHGLHHCCSSVDAEGYEFWDRDHNAPLSNDSEESMRTTITTGIASLTSLGLRPQLWETPHYSASPSDYTVVSEFFGAAWELRRPIGWLPWVLRRDQYDTMVLPENLGYVSLDGTQTVDDQLTRARELLACRNCVASGYLHPSTVRVDDVRRYVDGLRGLGYAFVDPAAAVRQYSSPRKGVPAG